MKAFRTPTLVGLAGALALAACGDDTTTKPKDTGLDTIFSDATNTTDTSPDANPAAVKTLEFEQAFGDDQKPCRQQPRCSIFISFTEQRTLKMVYSEDGVVTPGQTVKFALENDTANLGHLNTLSGVTDAQGIAQVVAKANSANVGQFVVKAYVDGGTNPPPAKYFDVVVTPKGQVPLTVVATYNGTRPVGTYSVLLYRQNPQGAPGCTDLLALMDQTASQSRDNVLLAQSAKFPEFDKLEQDGKQKYTVLAVSKNGNDTVQAWGCNATEAEVEWGKSKTVTVELTDRPPLYKGAYDVISKFDFISAIPEPYRTYVNYVVEFFQDPTGTILKLACDLLTAPGDTLNSFCDLVFDEDGSGNLQLSALGGFVSDLLDAVIQGLLADTVFSKIFQVGGDVADILKEFELRATFTFKKEPDATGKFADGDTTENWHTVKVKWTLGANCDPDTEQGCGVQQFSMSAFQQQAVTGSFKAQVANFYDLTIDMHPLNLKYGALISYFMEAFLIPLVVNNPTVNSYEDLLGYLVGSGAACLNPGIDDGSCPTNSNADTNCCCNKFADGVGSVTGNTKNNGAVDSGTEGAVAAACDVIIKTAPTFLRTTLTNLDLSSGDTFNIGTKQACKMSDGNEDLIIDGFGSQSAPCLWNVLLKFGSTEVTIDSKFWGKRTEE
ncbi:MAG: hypothetical protein U1F43_36045 [Myxococcota bacterium]